MSRHSALSTRTNSRSWLCASVAVATGTTLLVGASSGNACAVSLPGIKGIPSVSIGPQPAPPSSYTTIREAEPGQPTVIVAGGTDDADSMQQLARLQSQLPPGVGIKTINSPQSVGIGWDGLLVIGTGAYTYQTSTDASKDAVKAAILASQGEQPVQLVGYSQGATIVEQAVMELAASGQLPPGTTVAVYGDPNTLNSGLANWGPAFMPGLPPRPTDVGAMPVPTTITNFNQDTWAANVSSNPLVALFYLAPGSIVHGRAYTAEEMARWEHTGTVTQIGDNTTLVVLHPKTAGGQDINPWFYAADLLLREAGLPELNGPVYEVLNLALNLAVPLGESGQPTTIGGIRIPTVNELTQPFAGVSPTSIPQFDTLHTEQPNDVEETSRQVPNPEPVIEPDKETVQPESTPATSVVDPPSGESVSTQPEATDDTEEDSSLPVELPDPVPSSSTQSNAETDSGDSDADTSDSSEADTGSSESDTESSTGVDDTTSSTESSGTASSDTTDSGTGAGDDSDVSSTDSSSDEASTGGSSDS